MGDTLKHVVVGTLRHMILAVAACGAEVVDCERSRWCHGVCGVEAVAVARTCCCAIAVEEYGVAITLRGGLLTHYLHQLPCSAHKWLLELATLAAVAATCGSDEAKE